jgi:protein LTV1
LIRARDAKAISKIRLHPITGLPTTTKVTPLKMEDLSEEDEDDGDRCMSFASVKVKLADVRSALKVPVTRLKGESKEEKKSRKNAAKEERRNRRVEKKATRTEFTIELKKQQMSAAQKEKSRMKKL